ncbi:MAG: hypothetical protein ACFN3F_07765, partial [Selenomonas sp.]
MRLPFLGFTFRQFPSAALKRSSEPRAGVCRNPTQEADAMEREQARSESAADTAGGSLAALPK